MFFCIYVRKNVQNIQKFVRKNVVIHLKFVRKSVLTIAARGVIIRLMTAMRVINTELAEQQSIFSGSYYKILPCK